MKSIFDPAFRYTKAVDTDIRKTFERVREEMDQRAQLLEESFWEWHELQGASDGQK